MRLLSTLLCCFLLQPSIAQPLREIDPAGKAYQGLSFLDTLLQRMLIDKSFDAVILVNGVTAPVYLR